MTLTVNGHRRSYPAGTTLADVKASLPGGGAPGAVYLKGTLVPAGRLEETQPDDGDDVRVVLFLGGG